MRRILHWVMLCIAAIGVGGAAWEMRGASAHMPAAQLSPDQAPLFDTRVDLEVLADAVFGVERPDGWTGSINVDTLSFVIDLWVDNERLADSVFGAGVRPVGWTGTGGATPNNRTLARNVRRDLEITADEFYGRGQRPPEWRGAPPIVRCGRSFENLLVALDRFYGIRTNTPESALDYCRTVLVEIEGDLIETAFNRADASGNLPNPFTQLGAVRGDLERMSDELLGLDVRPPGYSIPSNRDPGSFTFKDDLARDLNVLADSQLEGGERPVGWIALDPPPVNDIAAALYFRRDIELLAEATLEARFGRSFRPGGWQGTPIERCDVASRALAVYVADNYPFDVTSVNVGALDFCAQLDSAVNNLIENPPILDVVDSDAERGLIAVSNYAFAYLDLGATQYMGIMPGGVEFRAVYRNYGQSRMMLVANEQFAVFVDYRFTTLAEQRFNNLPTLDNASPVTFCDDFWCSGPGPTPTPTGGALLNVLIQTTPIATPDTETLQTTKRLVSWEFIRVTYLTDNLATRTAQVTLEICVQQAAVATQCESVISVFDNAAGVPKPVLGQANGLNIFEIGYGYTPNVLVEGETLYSNDVWISDPTIR
ncbi:MAG: hypothetical protein SGI73_18370 [Chloroflexota bacterium]|nr:hypothetical protein [Chloroflexota bacterium]